MEQRECIVLAGGFGTRLQSVVKDVPKCMAEVAEKPFLYYLFQYLEKQKVSHVILSLGYKSEIVIDWLNKNTFPFEVSYVIESTPLGTGGAIKYAATKAKSESVFVVNGDTYFAVDFDKLQTFHQHKLADISLALKPMTHFDRYGAVELDEQHKIVGFNEKKYCETGLINGGIYLINKAIFENLELSNTFSFEKDVLENKESALKIVGCEDDSYFIDIGIPEDFAKANVDFLTL